VSEGAVEDPKGRNDKGQIPKLIAYRTGPWPPMRLVVAPADVERPARPELPLVVEERGADGEIGGLRKRGHRIPFDLAELRIDAEVELGLVVRVRNDVAVDPEVAA